MKKAIVVPQFKKNVEKEEPQNYVSVGFTLISK